MLLYSKVGYTSVPIKYDTFATSVAATSDISPDFIVSILICAMPVVLYLLISYK